jgi:hypothetical protein
MQTFELSAALLTSLWWHKRQRPLLHNIEWNVYLATQAIRFKPKSSFTVQLARERLLDKPRTEALSRRFSDRRATVLFTMQLEPRRVLFGHSPRN